MLNIHPTPSNPPAVDYTDKPLEIAIDYSQHIIPLPGIDDDDLTQPMFVSGGEADDTGIPLDNCCRIYSLKDFKGVHYDVCVFKSGVATQYDLKMIGWRDEISSFICGP